MPEELLNHLIPGDFPGQPLPCSIAGAKPKLALMARDGVYTTKNTALRAADYAKCEDLAQQMAGYCLRKRKEGHVANDRTALQQGLDGLRVKNWCPDNQNVWIMRRTAALLGWSPLDVVAGQVKSIDVELSIPPFDPTADHPLSTVERLLMGKIPTKSSKVDSKIAHHG